MIKSKDERLFRDVKRTSERRGMDGKRARSRAMNPITFNLIYEMKSAFSIEPYIIGRHEDILVLNKPYGWPTSGHSLEDDDCVQFHLMQYYGKMVWTIHQLDADTSGLCLFTLNKKVVSRVQAIWTGEGSYKEYLAMVQGEPGWEQREECSPIGMISESSLGVHPEGKSARTHFHVVARKGGFSLLRVRIYTGRTHQIRIHLRQVGHPLIGEKWYVESPCPLHHRQALHASRICLPPNGIFPSDTFIAPIPEDMLQLGKRLGLLEGQGEGGALLNLTSHGDVTA